MRRRVPVQSLRGSDPTLLEVQLQDLLRRPMGQLAPVNLFDLLALSELEEPPRSLRAGLADFQKRIAREVHDIPSGRSWDEFLDELEEIEPERVPHSFRRILHGQVERDDRNPERIQAMLEKWSEGEPEPFTLGVQQTKVQRAVRVEREPRGGERSRRPGATRAAPQRTVTEDDLERSRLIAELCLERLAMASDRGLGEQVLIAGVAHRAKEQVGHIAPHEITSVLKDLRSNGQVRYSAGRWSRPARW